jgi:flagellar protein FlbD
MIAVTRLDGTAMIVNCEQIAWIDHMADTVIALMNGEKLIVRERPEAIVDRVRDFKRQIVSADRWQGRNSGVLSIAPDAGDAR